MQYNLVGRPVKARVICGADGPAKRLINVCWQQKIFSILLRTGDQDRGRLRQEEEEEQATVIVREFALILINPNS